MTKNICAPHKHFRTSNKKYNFIVTCFSTAQLKHIANTINQHPSNIRQIKIKNNKQFLWDQINSFFTQYCDHQNESCWMEQPILQPINHNFQEDFIPKKPSEWNSNPRTWLNTLNIQDVLQQYEKKYRSFRFMGVFPIDYNHEISAGTCLIEELCTINIPYIIKSGIKQLGIVFNLDKHYEPGSHWVSIYIGLNPKAPNYGCYYFDSNAFPPTSPQIF